MFQWKFILRKLFASTSPRTQRKARRPRHSVKLEVEELKQRILLSASPGNPQSEPEPRIATILQKAIQVIDTVENEVVSLEKVETQEIVQAKANLIQD